MKNFNRKIYALNHNWLNSNKIDTVHNIPVEYYKMGQFDKAEKHYQKAYELMPDSYGRVESHCFGCEGIFSGKLGQGIAESVFSRLVIERPDKPQVHYLLGHLRVSQGRKLEAKTHFYKAVELDPDYINAWQELSSIVFRTPSEVKEKDRIIRALYRLSPNNYSILSKLSDTGVAWSLWSGQSSNTVKKGAIYALTSAVAYRAENKRENREDPYFMRNTGSNPGFLIRDKKSTGIVFDILNVFSQKRDFY